MQPSLCLCVAGPAKEGTRGQVQFEGCCPPTLRGGWHRGGAGNCLVCIVLTQHIAGVGAPVLVPHGSPGTMHAWPNLPGKAFPEHYQVGCPAGTLLAVPHSGLHSSPVMARVMMRGARPCRALASGLTSRRMHPGQDTTTVRSSLHSPHSACRMQPSPSRVRSICLHSCMGMTTLACNCTVSSQHAAAS